MVLPNPNLHITQNVQSSLVILLLQKSQKKGSYFIKMLHPGETEKIVLAFMPDKYL